jgi:hypothetical protein
MRAPAYKQGSYAMRRAAPAEASLVAYLRFASLVSLELRKHPLEAIRAFMRCLPDVDAGLVEAGRYFVADQGGDLIAGLGWSVLPLRFRCRDFLDEHGARAALKLGEDAVLLRGFFLDPDQGRRGAGAHLLAQVEADILRHRHRSAELIVPASARAYYATLGFKPVAKLGLRLDGGEPLPLIQMRKPLALPYAVAA